MACRAVLHVARVAILAQFVDAVIVEHAGIRRPLLGGVRRWHHLYGAHGALPSVWRRPLIVEGVEIVYNETRDDGGVDVAQSQAIAIAVRRVAGIEPGYWIAAQGCRISAETNVDASVRRVDYDL